MQISPQFASLGVNLVFNLTTTDSPQVLKFFVHFGSSPFQCSKRVAVFPFDWMTTNTYITVAVVVASRKNFYWRGYDTFAEIIIDRPWFVMVKIPTSASLFCFGVSIAVHLKLIPNFQSALLHRCSNFLFSSKLSLLTTFTGIFISFHFCNNSQVGSIIPFFVA